MEPSDEREIVRAPTTIKALFAHNQILHQILNLAQVGIYALESEKRFTFINQCMAELLGIPVHQLLKKNPLSMVHQQDRNRVRQEVVSRLKGAGNRGNIETRLIKVDGTLIEVSLNLSPLLDEHGRVMGVLGFVQDRSERGKLRRDQQKLEEHALMIEKLSALGRLSATVVHQINNPLEAIKNYVYLLRDEVSQREDVLDMFALIEREIFRIARLTRQIVEFAVPASSQSVEFNVMDVMEESLQLMDKKLRSCGVSLEKKYEEGNAFFIIGFPSQIKQLFIHLMLNSCESMTTGGILSINVEKAGDRLEISFCDTGTGIHHQSFRQIFNPFFSTKDSAEHLGLGLSVCFHIAHLHRGTIRVESEPGKGSCFIVSLPL